MEESSEKRRERLQAMRMDASNQPQPFSSSSSSSSSSQSLSNPLMNLAAAGERTPPDPRFDFYTDPMAAFSGSKRRHPYSSPTETFSSPVRSPSPLSYPSNRPSGGPGNYHVPGTQYTGFQFQTSQAPDQTPWRSPIQFQSPFSGHTGGTPPGYTPNPNSWNRSGGGSPGLGFRPNFSSRGRGLPSPSFRHGGSSSPHSNPGRGSGWQFRGSGSSPRPGRSGGRGRGFYRGNCSAPNDPHHLYKAVMKDPWRKLKPKVGSILGQRSGSASWLPKSIAEPKRAKVFDSGSKSRLSLAESLALSLEEAADDV